MQDNKALSTAPTLRPFDSQDWAVFSGVNSKEPLIAFIGDIAMVHDDDRIQIVSNEDDGEGRYWQAIFPSRRTAEICGNALLAEFDDMPDLTYPELLKQFGFTFL